MAWPKVQLIQILSKALQCFLVSGIIGVAMHGMAQMQGTSKQLSCSCTRFHTLAQLVLLKELPLAYG